ncbi:MAG: response regulator, partial [Deltaproteobacteria bacterium]|nr:response regulator [Deltaproteobacteria bacterium]
MKILVIDDEASTRDLLKMSLESDGYTVFVAEDGPKGLEIFARELPSVVLTDIKMPGMDGIEVLRRVKEQSPDTEVIVITGHGEM